MKRIAAFLYLILGGALAANAQISLTQTTLSAAVTTASTTTIQVASATGITARVTGLYIDSEYLTVNAVSGNTLTVQRGATGTVAQPHVSGAGVIIGPPAAFYTYDGVAGSACTNGTGLFIYTPLVNIRNGNQWLCSTVTGKIVPGFTNSSDAPQVTTAVASAAGLVTPSGPLFHITGALAITGFAIPVGFDPTAGGTICAIPDGAFTTTAATNIAIASTAVVGKVLCWAYDGNTQKFYPYY